MRENCPICKSKPADSFRMNFDIPDGWTLPRDNLVKFCDKCGFVWMDNEATQKDYDTYYRDRYGFGVNNHDNYALLNYVTNIIFDLVRNKDIKIADFGGGEGILVGKLKEVGFTDISVWDVDDSNPGPGSIDLVIANSVIEHIYDLDGMMQRFKKALKPDGYVYGQVPESFSYADRAWPPILDYNTKHINHFGVFQMDLMFTNYGFSCTHRLHYEYAPLNVPCYMAIYRNNGMEDFFEKVKMRIINYTDLAERSITHKIHTPVVIWGLGDIAWHILGHSEHTGLEIAELIDIDPAYKGTMINGIPVKDKVETDYPILIMAQGQKQGIKDNIKKLGLKNEVIDIDELIE